MTHTWLQLCQMHLAITHPSVHSSLATRTSSGRPAKVARVWDEEGRRWRRMEAGRVGAPISLVLLPSQLLVRSLPLCVSLWLKQRFHVISPNGHLGYTKSSGVKLFTTVRLSAPRGNTEVNTSAVLSVHLFLLRPQRVHARHSFGGFICFLCEVIHITCSFQQFHHDRSSCSAQCSIMTHKITPCFCHFSLYSFCATILITDPEHRLNMNAQCPYDCWKHLV